MTHSGWTGRGHPRAGVPSKGPERAGLRWEIVDVHLPAPEAHAASCDLPSACRFPRGPLAFHGDPGPILGTHSVTRVGLASL